MVSSHFATHRNITLLAALSWPNRDKVWYNMWNLKVSTLYIRWSPGTEVQFIPSSTTRYNMASLCINIPSRGSSLSNRQSAPPSGKTTAAGPPVPTRASSLPLQRDNRPLVLMDSSMPGQPWSEDCSSSIYSRDVDNEKPMSPSCPSGSVDSDIAYRQTSRQYSMSGLPVDDCSSSVYSRDVDDEKPVILLHRHCHDSLYPQSRPESTTNMAPGLAWPGAAGSNGLRTMYKVITSKTSKNTVKEEPAGRADRTTHHGKSGHAQAKRLFVGRRLPVRS